MSWTLTQLAYQSCRDLGCLRSGTQAVQSSDLLNDIKDAANQLLDAWRIDDLLAYAYPAAIYPLQNLLEQYQNGPGQVAPNFDAQRPTGIADANVIIAMASTPAIRKAISIWNKDEWASIPVRATPPGSVAPIGAIPIGMYYDGDFNEAEGYGTINLWPAPQFQPQSLELFTTQTMPFLEFADLTTAYSFPPAYARMIRKNLAVEILPMMWDRWKAYRLEGFQQPAMELVNLVKEQAVESKAAVMSDNAPDACKIVDPMFKGATRRGGWVYATGSYNGRI